MSHTSHAGAVSVDERRAASGERRAASGERRAASKYPTWGHLRSGSAR
jgi:hypothetical protein